MGENEIDRSLDTVDRQTDREKWVRKRLRGGRGEEKYYSSLHFMVLIQLGLLEEDSLTEAGKKRLSPATLHGKIWKYDNDFYKWVNFIIVIFPPSLKNEYNRKSFWQFHIKLTFFLPHPYTYSPLHSNTFLMFDAFWIICFKVIQLCLNLFNAWGGSKIVNIVGLLSIYTIIYNICRCFSNRSVSKSFCFLRFTS